MVVSGQCLRCSSTQTLNASAAANSTHGSQIGMGLLLMDEIGMSADLKAMIWA